MTGGSDTPDRDRDPDSAHRVSLPAHSKSATKPGTTAGGWGWSHQKLRRRWAPSVAAGLVDCARCGLRIEPGTPWDLGHDDLDRTRYSAHSPATVNLDITVLGDVLKSAKREELIDSNPAEGVERPKVTRRRWRILEPVEVQRVYKAFTDEQARTMFLTLALTGIRRFELQGLRWSDVDLVECVLRVRESKTEEGQRTLSLVSALSEALWQHRRRSAFQGADEYVFCHPTLGSRIGVEWYAGEFRAALKAAGITDYVRPFHDARHGALTNMAATSPSPIALMATAGHKSMATTNRYLHLAGVVFRDEAEALAARYNFVPTSANLSDAETTENRSTEPVRD